ncbi:T9SS C-terminal target domain-containing protein [Paraflavitalea soli]|uniref:T9SS C-terminal target domain-containing protein n=1 Tax=Paraflavitalea soli TaxID=2315862 RepID=A0A3B7MKG8_9BACT|nr:T9SS type A sorting domain-containing protein [Paraflavitalea soli]AXY74954.1 T9SS C-terminal target domain-containing protein [Paraflavitalea soli]
MNKLYQVCLLVLLAGSTSQVTAQTIKPFVFNVAGGYYNDPSSYFRFEWSIGEMTMIESLAPADSMILLTHGLLQPLTEIVGKSNLSLIFGSGEYRLFPNPTPGKFELDFFVRESGFLEIQLTDNNGAILERREVDYNNCCRIHYFDLSRYPAGTYYVVARLSPDRTRSDNQSVIRRSAFRVVKIDNK